jgi:type I restriction enzyme R subunit
MTRFTESEVEKTALEWLKTLGYACAYGPEIAPDGSQPERARYDQVILERRLRDALYALNPDLPAPALDEAFRKLTHPAGADLLARNRAVHRMLAEGVEIEYRRDGRVVGGQARVFDFEQPERNDFLAVNQFTVIENRRSRRPDVVLFINGLPLVVIELKNAADPKATLRHAFQQLQTYQNDIPALFDYNALLAVSDGLKASLGTLSAGWEWFKPWRTLDGQTLAPAALPELQILLQGAFAPQRLLTLLRHYIVFDDRGSGQVVKKAAGYHQFHAVEIAISETLRAAGRPSNAIAEPRGVYRAAAQPGAQPGDRRVGVVWHTQGAGKSLTMAFYAGRVIHHPAMKNPTLVVLTDRNDLDDQLFGTFQACRDLLGQDPVQAESRADLRKRLAVASGGVVFTTIQKFLPEEKGDRHPVLSERENIVVIADEAHRSQYGFIEGFARHLRDALPNASFIAFTGTPVELDDRNTRHVFGDYISIYDIQQAVADGATVPIYYESRLAQLALDEDERPQIDREFEEITEAEEAELREKLKTKWAQLEAIVGAEKRLKLLAQDIVNHFEKRQEALQGKAMVVCMSRRICVELYNQIVALRPAWHSDDDRQGMIKVVMTGSASDPQDWQPHIRDKRRREQLAERFRDPDDPFQIVLVRDMWLTGFDAPPLHTMYLDKPMRGHTLMQAIARVNRVFRDKPGGLVVDYIGLAYELKQAMQTYTESGGTGQTAIDQSEAVRLMLEKYDVCKNLFHGFDWSPWTEGAPAERLALLRAALEHILAQEQGRARLEQSVAALTKAFALAVPHPETLRIRDDLIFFQEVRGALSKHPSAAGSDPDDLHHAIRQIVDKAIAPQGMVDIFSLAGLPNPDLSILSDEFLEEVRRLPQRNLAVEALRRLLEDEIRARRGKNVVQSRAFSELLENALRRYQNRTIEAAQVIEELIQLAKDMRAADRRGEELGLTEDELAFYDALETNDSAVQVLGDETLRAIAQELVRQVRRNLSIDWTERESARARLRVRVKRILRKYGYPPDKQEKATETVLEQAAVLSDAWTLEGL